ncbi:testis-expressed protein 19 [Suricata suricatta]|uniref:testis-expressed protein 19 n=1 Tax=Suricata suricatta TaxID=37032 RepID=UPI0011558E55|nr:testis-expressed protein 19 [Suricata suricatta]
MCPPVSVRYEDQGLSCLHASWTYQLHHGDRPALCFACFKAAFLELRDLLELEDWEDEDWDPEPLDQAEPETGPSGGQEAGPDHHVVPTELDPQDAAPLGLGPEDANWTQGLPWRLRGSPTCFHWQGFTKVNRSLGEAMVLELGTTRAMDAAEAEAQLMDLRAVSAVGGHDNVYLQRMVPDCLTRTAAWCWELVLDAGEVWAVRLQDAPPKQDLHLGQLSILESSPPGQEEGLVPADTALLKRGFIILSYTTWKQRRAEEGASASGPQSSFSREWDAGTGSSGTEGPRPK